jgi:SAM-dependent methyltransferase
MFIDQQIRFNLIRSALGTETLRILDVGCGGGGLTQALVSDGHDVYSCDLTSSTAISRTVSHLFLADGSALPIASKSFDCAIACDVLEHVRPKRRNQFLSELLRVTRPNGKVVITVFVRNTKSFRLWGGAHLFFKGSLPQWYCEHVTAPLPEASDLAAVLSSGGAPVVRTQMYQRSLNLLCMFLQHVSSRASRLTRAAKLISQLDCLGRPTSCLIVAQTCNTLKPLAHGLAGGAPHEVQEVRVSQTRLTGGS